MIDVKFNADGLVPAVCRDIYTGEVLMLAWMNRQALSLTIDTGRVHFWSRSRRQLWLKGETSGNYLMIQEILIDCDADALLVNVRPLGPACHTGSASCFYREVSGKERPRDMNLGRLQGIIDRRKTSDANESYTAKLMQGPREKIMQKVGEEAVEVILAAGMQGRERLIEETADLFYHVLVLLANENVSLRDVYAELGRRHAQE